MNRLIPGKTKVQVELFRGVTIGDVVIVGLGAAMLLLMLISTLPHKLGVCAAIVLVSALLLVRIDNLPNYRYLLSIITHFAYKRHFGRLYNDQMLLDRAKGSAEETSFRELFLNQEKSASPKARKRRRKDEKAAPETETGSKKTASAKAEEKARAKARKEEDKRLKSKEVSEEEKQAIRDRRAQESKEAMKRAAEAKEAALKRAPMEQITAFTGIEDGYIRYGREYFGGVLEIDPVEFRFFSEHRRRNSIESCFGRILRSLHGKYCANIVKLERPVIYDDYLARENEKLDQLTRSFESGMLKEDEYKIRVEIEYDRINELKNLCYGDKIIDSFFYLVLFESDKRQLDMLLRNAEASLRQGELSARRLDNRELAVFLKYSNQLDFDEREVNEIRPEDYAAWAMPQTVDIRARRVEINHIVTHNFRVVNYPSVVEDAWLASVMSIPATKVVVKARQMEREKAVRAIDRSLMELRGQWNATSVDSRRMEIEEHLNTLQELLSTLQGDNEVLLECNIYVTAYDIAATRNNPHIPQPPHSFLTNMAEMKKNVRRSWQEAGFRLNNMEFGQMEAFIGAQISAYDPLVKDGRGIPSNTVAACYPWVFAHISDKGGILLGESAGIPVFINFFRRDSERVNSNMVIVGKSGSGKSYATKSLLLNLAAEDAKIFILDPENEYTELANNLHGKFINVGNAQYGRLNPFHIITALDDDEAAEGAPSGSYATHLQFLEEFFKQILPDCDKDALEYLNNMVDRVYSDHDITPETDLSRLTPEDYPIFDDLYETIVEEFQQTDNQYLRTMLRTLMNYIAKFSTGGRNANIWNGPSTVTTDENFTVFNFQSMLANRNTTVANAQMLLVLKYIDNEIIKNRDYNMKYGLNRKVVVVIDEAHVFIDAKYPIALDFMFQLAKRIRKYNGMQLVITQNIKDFVGSEEIARKSTAIINACQYSFIFALAPNDMQDLVRLYANAGGINESEQEQIVQAPRGQAFTIMSPTSRSTFLVDTPPAMTELFESRQYRSHYFSTPEGEEAWEAFAAESRAVRSGNVRESEPADAEGLHEDASDFSFELEEISGDDYDSGGFAFEELEEEPPAASDARTQSRQTQPRAASTATLPPDAPAFHTQAELAMPEALNRLAESVSRLSMEAIRSEVTRAVDARLQSDRTEEAAPRGEDTDTDAETDALRRRIQELESALSEAEHPLSGEPEKPSAAEEPEAAPESGIWDSHWDAEAPKEEQDASWDDVWDDVWGSDSKPEQAEGGEEEGKESGEEGGAQDDADDWSSIWESAAAEQDKQTESAAARERELRHAEDDVVARSLRLAGSMPVFERMLAKGQTVVEITMAELEKQIEANKQS